MNIQNLISLLKKSASDYPEKIFNSKRANYTCINPFSYGILRKYEYIIDKMDGIFVDGISMCWWINLYFKVKVPRLSFDMTTIAKEFFNRLSLNGKSVYFIGAKEEEITKTIQYIRNEFPNINISGFRNGYFSNVNDRNIAIRTIVNQKPDFVVIGMGTPLQEQFAIDLREAGYDGISFTCGGYLRQASTGIHYFPDWVNKFNLRGFYRQFKEKGIFKRNYNTLIEFPILFTYDTVISKFKNKTKILK